MPRKNNQAEQRCPMFDLGPHAGFIWLSYISAAVCIAGLVLWVWTDERAQTRRLADLERRGATRRALPRGACKTGNSDAPPHPTARQTKNQRKRALPPFLVDTLLIL